MKEYLGKRGNVDYLISLDSNEAYTFNSFGESISFMEGMSAYREVRGIALEINIVSILGESVGNSSEIYFNGKVAVVNKNYLDVYAKINKSVKRASHLIYRIRHDKYVNQVLLAIPKGSISNEYLSSLLNGLEWKQAKFN